MTFIVGLTGGIGSGKSAAANVFKSLGITVVDADEVAHEISADIDVIRQIQNHFGDEFVTKDKQLDRGRLRQKIFNDKDAKQWLEHLLHPRIRAQMMKQLTEANGPYVILSAPLLIENKLDAIVNRVLVIDVPEEVQRYRASKRDNNNLETIEKIMRAQCPRAERLKRADDIIDNQGDLTALEAKVVSCHQVYLQAAAEFTAI